MDSILVRSHRQLGINPRVVHAGLAPAMPGGWLGIKAGGWRLTRPVPLDTPSARPGHPWCNCPALAWVVLARRNPWLLFRLSGVFLLRLAERRLSGLLFQDPPRSTRRVWPTGVGTFRRWPFGFQGTRAFTGRPLPQNGSNQPPAKRVWRNCTV